MAYVLTRTWLPNCITAHLNKVTLNTVHMLPHLTSSYIKWMPSGHIKSLSVWMLLYFKADQNQLNTLHTLYQADLKLSANSALWNNSESCDMWPSVESHSLNLCSTFDHLTAHTHSHSHRTCEHSSGQPLLLWCPERSWGFVAFLNSFTSVLVLRVERVHSLQTPIIPASTETRTCNLCNPVTFVTL